MTSVWSNSQLAIISSAIDGYESCFRIHGTLRSTRWSDTSIIRTHASTTRDRHTSVYKSVHMSFLRADSMFPAYIILSESSKLNYELIGIHKRLRKVERSYVTIAKLQSRYTKEIHHILIFSKNPRATPVFFFDQSKMRCAMSVLTNFFAF